MAYYIVKYKGEHYLNRDLAQAYYGKPRAALADDQSLPTVMCLEHMLYHVKKTAVSRILDFFEGVTMQDIDQSLSLLTEEETDAPKKKCVITGKIFELDGFRFSRFQNLRVSNKYNDNKRAMIPHIKVCGTLYVAIKARHRNAGYAYYVQHA